jgi:hypothetical protein
MPLLASSARGMFVYGLGQLTVVQDLSPLVRLPCLVISGMILYAFIARRRIVDVWRDVAGRE